MLYTVELDYDGVYWMWAPQLTTGHQVMLTSSDGDVSYLLKNCEWEIPWPPDLEDAAEFNISKFVNGTKVGSVVDALDEPQR